MQKEGVESFDKFKEWLKEEKEWLLKKKKEVAGQQVTQEMEYVQKLVNLSASK